MSILQKFSACSCGSKQFAYEQNNPNFSLITSNPDPTCLYLTKKAACCGGCGSKCVKQCDRYGSGKVDSLPIPEGMYSCSNFKCEDDGEKRQENIDSLIMATSIFTLVVMVIVLLILLQ